MSFVFCFLILFYCTTLGANCTSILNTSTSLTTLQFLDFIPSLQTQHDSIANVLVCCLWFIYWRAVPTLTATQSKHPQPHKQLTYSDMHRTSGLIPQTLLVRVWLHETTTWAQLGLTEILVSLIKFFLFSNFIFF